MDAQSYSRAASAVELDEVAENIPVTASVVPPGVSELDKNQILLEADEFVTTYDLDDIRDMIRKGALLYHDREDVARVEDLTQAELEILLHHSTDEVKPFKPGESISSYFFYMAAILYSSLQHFGWELFEYSDEYYVPAKLKILPWIGSALFGCVLTIPLNRRFGRRTAVSTAAVLALSASWGSFVTRYWDSVVAKSAVFLTAGTAMGILGCTVPLYLAETSVSSSRGASIARWEINIAFLDILYMVARSLFGSVPFLYTVFDFYHAFTVLAGVIVLALVFSNRIPDSPHWCVSNEQMRKAFESLYHFRESHIIAACDLCHIYFTLDERMSRPDVHSTSLFSMALRSSQYKRAFVVLMGMMLMCNLSAVHLARDQAYFQTIASMGKISLEPSIAMGSFFCMYGILGKIDNFGRRPILIALTLSLIVLMQVPVIVWTMGDAALFMALCSAQWVFVTLYRSLKALYTIYAAEVFSRRYNDLGMAMIMSVNHGSLAAVAYYTSPLYESDLFPSRFYSSIPLFGSVLLAWLLMRETKNFPIEDIDSIFDLPSRDLIAWRIKVHLPYLLNRYVMWQDIGVEPLEESRDYTGGIHLE